MTHQPPHMAMLVGNQVVGDSRVLKAAESARKAGYRVTIVGMRNRTVPSFSTHDGIPVYRISAPFTRIKRYLDETGHSSERAAWHASLFKSLDPVPTAIEEDRAPSVSSPAQGSPTALGRFAHAVNEHAATLGQRYLKLWPQIEDYEEAFLRALVALNPDLIHVHDRHPMPAAATYSRWRSRLGRPIKWVYDAHEWLPGQHYAGPAAAKESWVAAERDLIKQADAVISVSDILADRMKSRHHLSRRPAVVVNAPAAGRHPMDASQRRTLREECGLEADTPLLVYVGKLSELRGIFDAVAALEHLPGVHLAFVCNTDVRLREELRQTAVTAGAADRLHLHNYVPARNVTWYVESATVGLSPLHPTTAHEAALPTKIREYIQSGLPLVVSDLAAQANFVREHSIGTVHRPGDARDLARAVNELLSSLDQYRGRLTDDFQRSHTWEGSEDVLFKVWDSLYPAPGYVTAAARAAQDTEPSLPALLGTPSAAVSAVLSAAAELAPRATEDDAPQNAPSRGFSPIADYAVLERPAAPPGSDLNGSLDGLDAAVSLSANLTAASAVVIGDALPIFNGHGGSPTSEAITLRDLGTRAVTILAPDALIDRGRLAALVPGHPLLELSGPGAERYDRQTHRIREGHSHGQWPLLSWGEVAVRQFPGATWLPYPAPREKLDTYSGPARILIAGTRRSVAEATALEAAAEIWRSKGYEVRQLEAFVPGAALPPELGAADPDGGIQTVLVDALLSGEPTPSAILAWARGYHVVSARPHPMREDLARLAPELYATPEDVAERVTELFVATTDVEAAEYRTAALHYVERVHRQEFLARLSEALVG